MKGIRDGLAFNFKDIYYVVLLFLFVYSQIGRLKHFFPKHYIL